eukprot:COSAG05_NODE_88_length_20344_cov_12.094690_11_plen_176_part_00
MLKRRARARRAGRAAHSHWIALFLPGGVFRVFRGFGQQETPPTHPPVFCGLDQKFLKDTPQFYSFSSVVHAEFCWNCRFFPQPCMYMWKCVRFTVHPPPCEPSQNSKNTKYPTRAGEKAQSCPAAGQPMGLLLRRFWGGYLRQLERRPVVVKATSSAITFSLTDALVRARAPMLG